MIQPKKKKEASEVKRLPIIFPIDIHAFAEHGDMPKEIHVLPVGKWNHPNYGPITISREDIAQFKENFDNGLRKGIPITEGHDHGFGSGELPAVGWFTDLIDRGANGLYAIVEWTEKGKTLLVEKAFKFFSPEFYSEYEDPETRAIHENVLIGGALTNKPYFKELDAVVLSENIINNQFIFNDKTMKLQNILAKEVADLTPEETTFLRENVEELTDEQKETFESALQDAGEGGGEGEGSGEGERSGGGGGAGEGEGGDGGEGGEGEGGGEGSGAGEGEGSGEGEGAGEGEGGQQNAAEFKTDEKGNVIMSMAEAKMLSKKANAGFEASKELKMSKIKAEANKLVFSEQNSKGRFLPAQSEKVFGFMKDLNETQRKTFAELVNAVPASNLFDEIGNGGNTEGSAFAEIEGKVKKLMSEDKQLRYADAVKSVCEENPKLAHRYETEK